VRDWSSVLRIDSASTRRFFSERALRYDPEVPENVVLYSDTDPTQARARSAEEAQIVLPLLDLCPDNWVLDVGCGIGRWAELVVPSGARYLGVDNSVELLEIARSRFRNASRVEFKLAEINQLLHLAELTKFDRIIIAGLLNYLNDDDVLLLFDLCARGRTNSRTYIRGPLAVGSSRLTLIDEWSEELQAYYSSVYRTESELRELIKASDLAGARVLESRPLFDDQSEHNLRSETRQYFMILDHTE